MRACASSGTSDHIINAIAINIACSNIYATSKLRVVGEEAADLLPALAAEHLDVRACASSGTSDHIIDAIAINIACSNIYATSKLPVVGKEAADPLPALAAEHLDVRGCASSGAGDPVMDTVPVNLTLRNAHTSFKVWIIGKKLISHGPVSTRKNAHMRTCACTRARDKVEVVAQSCTVNSSPSVDCKAILHTHLRRSHAGGEGELAGPQGIPLQCHPYNW